MEGHAFALEIRNDKIMKTSEMNWRKHVGLFAGIFLAVATILTAISQTVPVMTIAPSGTNQYSITFTNNIGTLDYDLMWTPVLANPNYPWTFAAIGTPGETNFILNTPSSQTGFFRAVLDTNAVPLWEAANPGNPTSSILQVYIYGPSNGAVLQ